MTFLLRRHTFFEFHLVFSLATIEFYFRTLKLAQVEINHAQLPKNKAPCSYTKPSCLLQYYLLSSVTSVLFAVHECYEMTGLLTAYPFTQLPPFLIRFPALPRLIFSLSVKIWRHEPSLSLPTAPAFYHYSRQWCQTSFHCSTLSAPHRAYNFPSSSKNADHILRSLLRHSRNLSPHYTPKSS